MTPPGKPGTIGPPKPKPIIAGPPEIDVTAAAVSFSELTTGTSIRPFHDSGSGVGFFAPTESPHPLPTVRTPRSALEEVDYFERPSSRRADGDGRSQQPSGRPSSRRGGGGGGRSHKTTTHGSAQLDQNTDRQAIFKKHDTLHTTSAVKQSKARDHAKTQALGLYQALPVSKAGPPTPRTPRDDSEPPIIPAAGSVSAARAAARRELDATSDASSPLDSRALHEQLSKEIKSGYSHKLTAEELLTHSAFYQKTTPSRVVKILADSLWIDFKDCHALRQVISHFFDAMLGTDDHVEIGAIYPRTPTPNIRKQTLITEKQYHELQTEYLRLNKQHRPLEERKTEIEHQYRQIQKPDEELQRLYQESQKIDNLLDQYDILKEHRGKGRSILKQGYIELVKYGLLPLPRLTPSKHAALLTKEYDQFVAELDADPGNETDKKDALQLLPDRQVDWQSDRDNINSQSHRGIAFFDWDDTLQCTWNNRRYTGSAKRMADQKDRLKAFFSELQTQGILPVIITARTKFIGDITDPCKAKQFAGVHVVYTACCCPKARVIDYYKRKTGIQQTYFADDSSLETCLVHESTACTTIPAGQGGDLDYIREKLQPWIDSLPVAAVATVATASTAAVETVATSTESTLPKSSAPYHTEARLKPLPKRAIAVDKRTNDESTAGTPVPTV